MLVFALETVGHCTGGWMGRAVIERASTSYTETMFDWGCKGVYTVGVEQVHVSVHTGVRVQPAVEEPLVTIRCSVLQ